MSVAAEEGVVFAKVVRESLLEVRFGLRPD